MWNFGQSFGRPSLCPVVFSSQLCSQRIEAKVTSLWDHDLGIWQRIDFGNKIKQLQYSSWSWIPLTGPDWMDVVHARGYATVGINDTKADT